MNTDIKPLSETSKTISMSTIATVHGCKCTYVHTTDWGGIGGISMSDAIDIYMSFLMWNSMAGGTLVPDSSSDDVILAFVGRCQEIYAAQNP